MYARLLCPWNFSGKNIGLGRHSFLQGIFPTLETQSPDSGDDGPDPPLPWDLKQAGRRERPSGHRGRCGPTRAHGGTRRSRPHPLGRPQLGSGQQRQDVHEAAARAGWPGQTARPVLGKQQGPSRPHPCPARPLLCSTLGAATRPPRSAHRDPGATLASPAHHPRGRPPTAGDPPQGHSTASHTACTQPRPPRPAQRSASRGRTGCGQRAETRLLWAQGSEGPDGKGLHLALSQLTREQAGGRGVGPGPGAERRVPGRAEGRRARQQLPPDLRW